MLDPARQLLAAAARATVKQAVLKGGSAEALACERLCSQLLRISRSQLRSRGAWEPARRELLPLLHQGAEQVAGQQAPYLDAQVS